MRQHHCFMVAEHLSHIDYLDEAIARLSTEIAARLASHAEEIALLDTIPGVSRRVAEVLLAEIGADMSRFPTAQHLASWTGLCPGNHQSAGKNKTGRTRKGSRWVRQMLVEAAHAAARSNEDIQRDLVSAVSRTPRHEESGDRPRAYDRGDRVSCAHAQGTLPRPRGQLFRRARPPCRGTSPGPALGETGPQGEHRTRRLTCQTLFQRSIRCYSLRVTRSPQN